MGRKCQLILTILDNVRHTCNNWGDVKYQFGTSLLMPSEAGWDSDRPRNPSISNSTISRVSSIVFRQRGVTLSEITKELKVSRTTAIRWLALMQDEGFLNSRCDTNGARGRPRMVYHPTDKLRTRVLSYQSDSLAILSFATFKGACKYKVGDECTLRPLPCGASVCPILHSENPINVNFS